MGCGLNPSEGGPGRWVRRRLLTAPFRIRFATRGDHVFFDDAALGPCAGDRAEIDPHLFRQPAGERGRSYLATVLLTVLSTPFTGRRLLPTRGEVAWKAGGAGGAGPEGRRRRGGGFIRLRLGRRFVLRRRLLLLSGRRGCTFADTD